MIIVFLLVIAAFLIASCTPLQPGEELPPTGEVISEIPFEEFELENETEEPGIPEREVEHNVSLVIYAVEGDLVDLNPIAEDPDGDVVDITFSEPFSDKGLWQTDEGDAGEYIVIVVASDGIDETEARVLISVAEGNKAPRIECPEEVTVKEGETIKLDCNIYDIEGDAVIVTYSGFMQSPVKTTDYEDAGEYSTVIQAADKEKTTTHKVSIIIEDKNRAPEIEEIEDIEAVEDDVIIVEPVVSDPDGNDIEIEFSDPLDEDTGVWKTKDGDDGVYDAYVKAFDGESTTVQRFKITVFNKNTAPVLREIDDITVEEGDLITLPIDAYDPEGDNLIVTFSGWMDSEEYQTTFEDAGLYTVQVTVSDGVLSTSQVVSITVMDKNRPPVFKRPG
jgi:hypothetical protein